MWTQQTWGSDGAPGLPVLKLGPSGTESFHDFELSLGFWLIH
jgi:hypothetical protein